MVTKYSQRELSERAYVNDNLTNVASEKTKKKSNLLRNLVITGAIVGGLTYGGYEGLRVLERETRGLGGAPIQFFLNHVGLKIEDFDHR